jgi:competence protein ComEA
MRSNEEENVIKGETAMSKTVWMQALAVVVALIFTAASGWAADPKAAAETVAELIDLNRATKAQLMTLTGVGELTAQRIIKNRPYTKKDQLKSMKILTPQEYDRIKDKIIARQPPKTK